MDKAKLLQGLSLAGWNRNRAAEMLGISRSTLFRAMRDHDVSLPKAQSRLTASEVSTIRGMAHSGHSHRAIAGRFSISKTAVASVIHHRTFKVTR